MKVIEKISDSECPELDISSRTGQELIGAVNCDTILSEILFSHYH